MINFILVSKIIISFYLILILISFDPADPSWMQSNWNGSVFNFGGISGARIADFLFFTFGGLAYMIPLFILIHVWKILVRTTDINFFNYFIEYISILICLCICCGLFHVVCNDIFYFPMGGIIGHMLSDLIILHWNTVLYINLILLFIGVIYYARFLNSFFCNIIKKIYKRIIYIIYIIFNILLKNKNTQYDRVRQQAYFNKRIYPSIFLIHNRFKCKESNLDSIYIHKIYDKNVNIIVKSLNQRYLSIKNNLIPSEFLTSVYKKTFSSHCNCKYWINQFIYIIFCIINNIICYTKIKNRVCFRKKRCIKKVNQYFRFFLSRRIIFNIFKKKLFKKEIVLNKSVLDQSKHVNDFYTQKKPMIIKKNINKYTYASEVNSSNFVRLSQKKHDIYSNFPNINLLKTNIQENITNNLELKKKSQLIEKKLLEYRVLVNVKKIIPGPIITRFELSVSAGVKSSKISGLSRDLARSLSVASVRVIEVIPGTPYVGLEIPNEKRKIVYLKDIISSDKFQKNNVPLALVFGQDISGQPVIEDLRYMPHLLVAGTTGSGKSISINAMIVSMLYKLTPKDVRFIMIDPKILELSIYSNIPHLLKEVITNVKDTESMLIWCIEEMEYRYKLMSIFGVRNLENYNYKIQFTDTQQYSSSYSKILSDRNQNNSNINYLTKKLEKLPYIVVIIDEFADLIIMTAKRIEILIIRLTQKARAAGIHLILSTQRPSVNVITGLIKANIPARIAFSVSSKIDSRTILGQSGAESLLGMGDMLYLPANSFIPVRIHGAYIQDEEIHRVVNFWKNQKNSF